ncbi:OsmC family protein [Sedimentimonas flavescens]|uniref:OsmC family protein n=1 Tax=Sedimentimonas flavescens TaxID=2851012 RepID=A0ABT3A2S6_9RHOB|nr:OsmC family protein [Sedimentimonas flavescens]MBW0159440.1 OsmC family protein [Sedimentimonas flavescens]MCT2541216.1 OsmC family protein [Sedimentimonas flavescens]MCV2880236.1 OsmC family protein [Sedimentimonas flavescens]
MRNSIPTAALSEFVNEVQNTPEEAVMEYGIEINWESGTRSRTETKAMKVGPHQVSRSFSWKSDEPRQLMGNNHGANPQELLLSGLGSCMMVSFIAGATAAGIQLESVRIDFDATLDLRGFLGIGSNATVGFPEIRYTIHATGDASEEEFAELHRKSVAHSPNAQTILNPVKLNGAIVSTRIEG